MWKSPSSKIQNSIIDIAPASDSAFTMVGLSAELIIGSKNSEIIDSSFIESTLTHRERD
jgi:hypothetical protein